MRFQSVKCNMMQLTNKHASKIQASYKLEGTVLENVESIKYLGVTITKDLKWNTHISNVCTKANRTLGFFRRNLFSREAAYKGLVRPILEYSSSVWDPHYEGLIDDFIKEFLHSSCFCCYFVEVELSSKSFFCFHFILLTLVIKLKFILNILNTYQDAAVHVLFPHNHSF